MGTWEAGKEGEREVECVETAAAVHCQAERTQERETARESPILAQQYYSSAAISTTMAVWHSQHCAIDPSSGNPIHAHAL